MDFLVICLIGDSPVSPVKKITFEEGSSFSLVIVVVSSSRSSSTAVQLELFLRNQLDLVKGDK